MLNLSSIYKRIYKYLYIYNYVEKNGSIYLNKIPVIPYDNNLWAVSVYAGVRGSEYHFLGDPIILYLPSALIFNNCS